MRPCIRRRERAKRSGTKLACNRDFGGSPSKMAIFACLAGNRPGVRLVRLWRFPAPASQISSILDGLALMVPCSFASPDGEARFMV